MALADDKEIKMSVTEVNDALTEKELVEIREKVARGIEQAYAGEGIDAHDYLEILKAEQKKLS